MSNVKKAKIIGLGTPFCSVCSIVGECRTSFQKATGSGVKLSCLEDNYIHFDPDRDSQNLLYVPNWVSSIDSYFTMTSKKIHDLLTSEAPIQEFKLVDVESVYKSGPNEMQYALNTTLEHFPPGRIKVHVSWQYLKEQVLQGGGVCFQLVEDDLSERALKKNLAAFRAIGKGIQAFINQPVPDNPVKNMSGGTPLVLPTVSGHSIVVNAM